MKSHTIKKRNSIIKYFKWGNVLYQMKGNDLNTIEFYYSTKNEWIKAGSTLFGLSLITEEKAKELKPEAFS